MTLNDIPPPAVLPVDREKWHAKLSLSNFVNCYYQYRDLQLFDGCKKILIVGPGQGLCTEVLKWKGYEVTTLDIDETLRPDHVGSVHEMSRFETGSFDAVIASHVLEHLAEPYLDASLIEIARVGRYALIYLPVHGVPFQVRFLAGIRNLDFSFILDLFNYFEKPDGITPRYMEKQHYWEIGMKGFRRKDMKERMSRFFEVLHAYRNRDWFLSQNFVLKSRVAPGTSRSRM